MSVLNENIETTKIKIHDRVKTPNDKVTEQNHRIILKGKVKIKKNDETILEKDNLIVLSGRHWLMERMFGLPYSLEDQKHLWNISWFSAGSGGATEDAPMHPIWPADEDKDVYYPVDFREIDALNGKVSSTQRHKLIDSIEFVSYNTAKVTMTIDFEDCEDCYINELGLYSAPSESVDNVLFDMVSHVTFPSIPKSFKDKLVVEWYYVF